MSFSNFFGELKRRNVYKVAIAYAVVAWLLMQVASQIFPFFEIPNWAVRLVVLLLIIGFPVALILAWAFELTPEGIKREKMSILANRSPFYPSESLSSDKENAYFADGIQHEILTRLSKIADLQVISRTSTQHFKSALKLARNRQATWRRPHPEGSAEERRCCARERTANQSSQ